MAQVEQVTNQRQLDESHLQNESTRRKKILDAWNNFTDLFGSKIPEDILAVSHDRINRIIEHHSILDEAERRRPITGAFAIHTRHSANQHLSHEERRYLNDARRVIPALDEDYGVTYDAIDDLWHTLGAFEVGRVKGTLPDLEKTIEVTLVSVPITPNGLLKAMANPNKTEGYKNAKDYARPGITDAIDLALNIAAKNNPKHNDGSPITIGLGETLASLTRHGRDLSDNYSSDQLRIVTGHNTTTAAIIEHANAIASEKGKPLSEQTITVIGANGSICTAVVEVLAELGVGQLVLHDIDDAQHNISKALISKAQDLELRYPNLKNRITTLFGEGEYNAAFENADIGITAASSAEPFLGINRELDGRFTKTGQILHVIDDGQPANVTAPFKYSKEQGTGIAINDSATYATRWPTVRLPDNWTRSFDYGLYGGEWPCLTEVIISHTPEGKQIETTGPTTVDRVKQTLALLHKYGIKVGQPESWGRIYDPTSR